eukprot:6474736-Amphidinium_carterae.2
MLEFKGATNSAWTSAELLLQALGWTFATKGSKRLPVALQFAYLGAILDLRFFRTGKVAVKNKPERTTALLDMVKPLEKGTHACRRDLERLKGKLLYASQWSFGLGLRQ